MSNIETILEKIRFLVEHLDTENRELLAELLNQVLPESLDNQTISLQTGWAHDEEEATRFGHLVIKIVPTNSPQEILEEITENKAETLLESEDLETA